LPRPPAPPKTTIPGTTCVSDAAPPAVTVPGINVIRPAYDRAAGMALISSLSMTVCRRTLCTSTMGVSPVTTIVSSSAPTFKSAFTTAVKDPGSSMPSRLATLNPWSVNVTV
jgi:hypothetical protein